MAQEPTPPVITPKAPPPTRPTVPPSVIIQRTAYPKWWKDSETEQIYLPGPAAKEIIPARGGYRLFIATIVLTVSGETDIEFGFGVFGHSGPMDFGAPDEPRGIVIAMGNSPAPCGEGGFSVNSNGTDVSVGGFVVYYREPE